MLFGDDSHPRSLRGSARCRASWGQRALHVGRGADYARTLFAPGGREPTEDLHHAAVPDRFRPERAGMRDSGAQPSRSALPVAAGGGADGDTQGYQRGAHLLVCPSKTLQAGCVSSRLEGNSVRRCPTLPHPGGCSTIGAGGLSFRVRNGAGRFPSAMTAVTGSNLSSMTPPPGGVFRWAPHVCGGWVVREPYSGRALQFKCCVLSCWPLVPVSSTPYGASTSGLSTQWSAGGLQHAWCMETSS